MLNILFDQEYQEEAMRLDSYREGEEKGIEKGIEQGIEKGRLEERTEGLRSMVETVKSLVGDDFKKVCEIIKKNKLYENVSEEEIKKFWK